MNHQSNYAAYLASVETWAAAKGIVVADAKFARWSWRNTIANSNWVGYFNTRGEALSNAYEMDGIAENVIANVLRKQREAENPGEQPAQDPTSTRVQHVYIEAYADREDADSAEWAQVNDPLAFLAAVCKLQEACIKLGLVSVRAELLPASWGTLDNDSPLSLALSEIVVSKYGFQFVTHIEDEDHDILTREVGIKDFAAALAAHEHENLYLGEDPKALEARVLEVAEESEIKG